MPIKIEVPDKTKINGFTLVETIVMIPIMLIVMLGSGHILNMSIQQLSIIQAYDYHFSLVSQIRNVVSKPKICKFNFANLHIPINGDFVPLSLSSSILPANIIAQTNLNYFSIKIDSLEIQSLGGVAGSRLANIVMKTSLRRFSPPWIFKPVELSVYLNGVVNGADFVVSGCKDGEDVPTQLALLGTCPAGQMVNGALANNQVSCTLAPPGPPGPSGPPGSPSMISGSDGSNGSCNPPGPGGCLPPNNVICTNTGWSCQ